MYHFPVYLASEAEVKGKGEVPLRKHR